MKGQQERQDEVFQPLSLQDLPALALACIYEAVWERDAGGFCTSARDAVSFRSTCKRLYEVAQLPSMLKLSFMDAVPDLYGLARMLSKQRAAGTHVSLRLLTSDDKAFYKDEDKECESTPSAFSNLSALGSRLVCLDIPCISVAYILDNVRENLMQLQHLTLRLSALYSRSERKRKIKRYNGNRLSTLTLSVPPWSAPMVLNEPLHLQDFPVLQQFVLRGPIVKDEDSLDDDPIILPLKTKVTIDPGLCGRKPTPWARQLAFYGSFEAMPFDAIPSHDEYREEDHSAREERILAFQDKVVQRAIEMDGGPSSETEFLDAFVSGMLGGPALENFMSGAECYYRSDILLEEYDVEYIARHALEEHRAYFEECIWEGMMLEGYGRMW
ncbi:hypothetical protein DUNSADRAFT_3843 [Dunaliella salina]|uniref:Uncharacterized protein n=1 Tax=Dunaliella salina TaxID=3046 RepID=A0ABQ7FV47_DUNSA|nr:hypothetical protein DUNSADRAFT_3843 [Dunaliella salina]|eukprot:KAF5826267.1 hypothetical protein DUNSADRAFT_3843 [Dunaliella salina]